MTPLKVSFTGLDLDPTEVFDRIEHGLIPPHWFRHRFFIEPPFIGATGKINRWLADNIDGRWAIFLTYIEGKREITLAFEHAHDGAMFVISDGAKQAALGAA